MNRNGIYGLAGAAVLVAGACGYYYWQSQSFAPAPTAAVPAGPRIDNPLPPGPSAALPALNDSDGALTTDIATLFHSSTLPDLIYPTRLAQRFVATIDNLPREQVAATVRMLKPPGGAVVVHGEEPSLSLAPENSARYAAYLKLLAAVDAAGAAALYRHYYPLLQQAYDELGYPGHYFNDRVVEVIDHLLATPDVADPVPLIRPSVMYKFADPRIEGRSAGQKALIRLGHDDAALVKAKLREIRALIATRPAA
jgi:DUF3014 family protein